VCASLNRFNTMREWLPIPSAAPAITLRRAARNATGLYNCFLTAFLRLLPLLKVCITPHAVPFQFLAVDAQVAVLPALDPVPQSA
jgi:hypothetical protein